MFNVKGENKTNNDRQNSTQKTKYWETRTRKNGGELSCFGGV